MGYLSFAPEFRRVMVDWRYLPHSRPTRGHDSTSTTRLCLNRAQGFAKFALSFCFLLQLDCLLCLSIPDCADAGNGCDAVWLADIA